MRTRRRRIAAAVLMLFQLVLGTRGFLWSEPSLQMAPTAQLMTSHATHAATTTDAPNEREAPVDTPCHRDVLCHAGPPCCGPVVSPAFDLRLRTSTVVARDGNDVPTFTTQRLALRLDHALPLATAPPALS